MVVLWFLSSFPAPPAGATGPAIQYSFAGMIGRALEYVFAPIGFNWQISIALVPGLAAREVAVGALGTVYALSAAGDDVADALAPVIAQGWSLATALLAARLVRVRAAMHLDAGGRQARNQLVALPAADGGVPVRAGLRRRRSSPTASRWRSEAEACMARSLIVALLVLGCAVYAAWTLMPAAARRALAVALLKLPLPLAGAPLRSALRAPCSRAAACVRLRSAAQLNGAPIIGRALPPLDDGVNRACAR